MIGGKKGQQAADNNTRQNAAGVSDGGRMSRDCLDGQDRISQRPGLWWLNGECGS